MYYVFNKSCIGYSHVERKKPCQDFSSSYKDNERIIITCCDGHGGNRYIRSSIGSKLASDAIVNVFKSINKKHLLKDKSVLINEIKLLVLIEYNKLVEQDLKNKPIRQSELEGLNEVDIDALRFNPVTAYGTTLVGAMLYKKKYIIVSIGDTEALGIRKGELVKIFDTSNDPAGNVTYSMCQEDAFQYLRVEILNMKELDGILLCTDGVSSPYQSYDNFNNSFVKPFVLKILTSKSIASVDRYIDQLGLYFGIGDDVSLSFIISDKASMKYYK